MPVSATIEDNEAEFEEADAHATLALCDLLVAADTGQMTLMELARHLKELTATAPEHMDAPAHLGSVLRECEQTARGRRRVRDSLRDRQQGSANRLRRTDRVDPTRQPAVPAGSVRVGSCN